MATMTACAPKRAPISSISSGRRSAAEFTLILSAPASKTAVASSSVRTPPPTVKGTKRRRAVRRTVSSSVPRASCVAVMSSNTISSAPALAWRAANSAGSPALMRSTNCTPLTTRPLFTSRQAMMRLVSMEAPRSCAKSANPPRRTSRGETVRPLHCLFLRQK